MGHLISRSNVNFHINAPIFLICIHFRYNLKLLSPSSPRRFSDITIKSTIISVTLDNMVTVRKFKAHSDSANFTALGQSMVWGMGRELTHMNLAACEMRLKSGLTADLTTVRCLEESSCDRIFACLGVAYSVDEKKFNNFYSIC